MPTTSSGRQLTIPTVAGDVGAWGGELNNTLGFLDAMFSFQTTLSSSTVGTNATLTTSEAQTSRIVVNNVSAGVFQLNIPASVGGLGEYRVTNNSSQGQNLTITAGSSGTGGSNVTIASSLSRAVYSDGVNITLVESNLPGSSFAVATSSFAVAGISIAAPVGLGNGLTSSGNNILVNQTAPTVQNFISSGSTTYFPTSTGVLRIRVLIAAGGGGGGAETTNNGSSGGTTSFGGWSVIGGAGGLAQITTGSSPAPGGTGGANGTGTLIRRIKGGDGCNASMGSQSIYNCGGPGGVNPLGGAGAGTPNGPGGAAAPNTGAGGAGAGSVNTLIAGGPGGAGELAEFWVTAPSTGGIALTVGAGGPGGAAGTLAGGAGATGRIDVEEFYI